jgi:hypothetical protein
MFFPEHLQALARSGHGVSPLSERLRNLEDDARGRRETLVDAVGVTRVSEEREETTQQGMQAGVQAASQSAQQAARETWSLSRSSS